MPITLSADIEQDLRGARLFVYLSYSEGLGSAALLAMSAGVPVVASDVDGLREVIRHRDNGLLVANEPAPIARAIREVIDNPEFANRLAQAARRTVADRFTSGDRKSVV